MIAQIIAVVAAISVAACTSSPDRSGEMQEGDSANSRETLREDAFTRPPYPQDNNLMEFSVGATYSHRYFIDTQSISVGTDGVARYTVVVKTAGGATNVFFEGMRCEPAQKRIYALGRTGGQWIDAKRADWTPIPRERRNDYHGVLYEDGFCRDRMLVRNREEVLFGLRAGSSGRSTID